MDYGTLLDEPGLNVSTETTSHPTLIVLSGSRSGQCFRLEPGNHVLGRGWDADLFLDDESVSRKHAEFTVTREGQYYLRDLGSTNGTKVNGIPITGKPQRIFVGDRIRLSSTACVKLRVQDNTEEQMQQALYNMAIHDPLTGAFNKRYLAERIDQEVAFAWRRGRPLSLIILDLDRFKAVNDTHGHDTGDALLAEVATRLRACVRETDTVARMGGDEFTVLLTDLTADPDASMVARRMLDILAAPFDLDGTRCRIGASIGIASYPDHAEDLDALMAAADGAMYAVKRSGKNEMRVAAA